MIQDFTTYTEYDLDNDIEFTASKVDFVTYIGTKINRLYKDFGAGFLSGDFTHQVEVQYTDDDSASQYGYPGWVTAFMLSTENSGRIQDIIDAGESAIGIGFRKEWNSNTESVYLFEVYGGVLYTAARVGNVSPDKPHYGRVSRSGNTLTWTIYTNFLYETVSTTRTLTLHGTPSYRYVNIGGGYQDVSYFCWITGFTQNLILEKIYPLDAAIRVTNIIHRYDKRAGINQLEMSLGDTTSALGLPYESAARRVTTAKQQEQDAAPIIDEAVRKAVEETTEKVIKKVRSAAEWKEIGILSKELKAKLALEQLRNR